MPGYWMLEGKSRSHDSEFFEFRLKNPEGKDVVLDGVNNILKGRVRDHKNETIFQGVYSVIGFECDSPLESECRVIGQLILNWVCEHFNLELVGATETYKPEYAKTTVAYYLKERSEKT